MKFQVDVSWTFIGGQIIEADSEEDAIQRADDLPLESYNGDYVYGSFTIDCVEETKVD